MDFEKQTVSERSRIEKNFNKMMISARKKNMDRSTDKNYILSKYK